MNTLKADFIYEIPTKVYFGENRLDNLVAELKKFGKRVLLVYGGGSIKSSGLYDRIMEKLEEGNMKVYEISGIEPNPRHTSVNRGASICKTEKIDVILAAGGGSVIDAAKMMALGTFYEGDSWDIIKGRTKVEKALPVVTILTLAATGSEMDAKAVISNMETNEKMSIKTPLIYPKVSFLDPVNTFSVDRFQTACGSADIISHVMEDYFGPEEDLYMLDRMMESVIKTVVEFAPIALDEPDNYEARANLMWASSWAINGFFDGSKKHRWVCHAMEHELSAFYDVTHGLGLAIVTPAWLRYVLNEKTALKIATLGRNVFEVDRNLNDMDGALETIDRLEEFFYRTLGLSSTLSEVGIDDKNFPLMAEKACRGKTLKGFTDLGKDDLEKIFWMCR